ncbi:T3SS effector HopA1 family protein [Nocardia sp. CA-107356]|uniref:T3SS effector HopA1 family protein n=1 Tax=Nocardia sp. CA-107356 TaxID=3239972 RepID=UPI003D928754
MTITLPAAFPKWLVEAVAGYWPDCDEDAVRREGDCWKATGDSCHQLGKRHDAVCTTEKAALHGYSADTKATRNVQLGDDLRNQAEYCNSMAEQCYQKANDCEFTKLQVIGTGIVLLTQLAVDALMSAPGVVKAAEDRAAAEASWTASARRYYGKIKKVGLDCATKRKGLPLAKATAIGFALGGGTAAAVNAGAQYYQKGVLHHRDKMDWNMVQDAAIIGGVGGGIGARFASRFAPGINKFFGKVAGKSESNIVRYGAHVTAGVLIGGAGGVAGAISGAGAGIVVTGHIPNAEELRTSVIQGFVGGFVGSATIFTRPLPPGMRVKAKTDTSNSNTSTTPTSALRDGDVPRDGYAPRTTPPATPPHPRPATPPDGDVPRDGYAPRTTPPATPPHPRPATPPDGDVPPDGYVPRTTPPTGGTTPPTGGTTPPTGGTTPPTGGTTPPTGGTTPPTGGTTPPTGGTTPPGGRVTPPPGTFGPPPDTTPPPGTTGPHSGGTDPGSGGPTGGKPAKPATDEPATPTRPPHTDGPDEPAVPRTDNDRDLPPRQPQQPEEGTPPPDRPQGEKEPAAPQPAARPHTGETAPAGGDKQVWPPRTPDEEAAPPAAHAPREADPAEPPPNTRPDTEETAAPLYDPENHSPFALHPDRAQLDYAVERFPEVFDRPRTLEELHQAIPPAGTFAELHQALRPDLTLDEFARLAPSDMTLGEAHQALRPDMSFDEFFEAVQPDMSFDELMRVRDFSYQLHGLEPPTLSRENLESFLYRVRGNEENIHNWEDIYRLYRSTPEYNIPSNRQGFIKDMGDILRQRTGDNQKAHIQGGREYIVLTPENAGRVDPLDVDFLRYHRPDADPDAVSYRVYVNARADEAPALMDGIVREIVDRPDDFPGIYMAKVGGPYRLSTDGLVIYVNELPDAYRVADWLKDYQGRNPDAFLWDVPAMTHQVMEGVGIGASTPDHSASFGELRSKAIFEAVQSTRAGGGDFAAFREAVLARLREAGVNPDSPYENYTR